MIESRLVDFFAYQCHARDQVVAEREVVLTYALHLLANRGVCARIAFKGGTALRKLVFGAGGRFSEDLDFTLYAGDKEEAVIAAFDALDGTTHHGITFRMTEPYETDGSFGAMVTYRHSWNENGTFKFEVSTRETPTLAVVPRPAIAQPYFKNLEFGVPDLPALAPIEMIAEKLRAAYQRAKVRDVYDLYLFATLEETKAFDVDVLRPLMVLKLWQVKEPQPFDGRAFFERLRGSTFQWDELTHLLPPGRAVDVEEMLATIEARFEGLTRLTDLESRVVADSLSGWNEQLADQLCAKVRDSFG